LRFPTPHRLFPEIRGWMRACARKTALRHAGRINKLIDLIRRCFNVSSDNRARIALGVTSKFHHSRLQMGLSARVTRSFAAALHNSRALWDFCAVNVVIEKFPRENAKCSSRHADTPIISGTIPSGTHRRD